MLLSQVLTIKRLITILTVEGLYFIMSTKVILHVPLRCKTRPTDVTWEWPLISVDSHVNLQIRFLGKGFPTPFKGTHMEG